MVSLDCFFLVLHPLSSLINNDLNLPLGSQGRSRKLNEAYFRVSKERRTQNIFVPRNPTGSCLVSVSSWRKTFLALPGERFDKLK